MSKKAPFTLEYLTGLAMDSLGYLYDKELFKDNLLNYVLRRTYILSQDDAGFQFDDYSDSYVTKRMKAGIPSPSKVRLSYTGEMLNSLRVIEDTGGGNIGSKIRAGGLGTFRIVSDDNPRGIGVTNSDLVNFINDGTRDRSGGIRGNVMDFGKGRPSARATSKRSKWRMSPRRFLYIDELELDKIIEDTLGHLFSIRQDSRPALPFKIKTLSLHFIY